MSDEDDDVDLPEGTTINVVVAVACPECRHQVDVDMTEGDGGSWCVDAQDRFPNCEECGTAFEVPLPTIAERGTTGEWPPSPDVLCREKTAALDERLDRLAEFATDLGFQGHAETVTITRQRVRDLTESYLAACAENDSLRARLGKP